MKSAFGTFVRKEFFHILRDRRTMMVLFLMPIIQILLFGFAITSEVKNVKVSVLDYVQNSSTQKIRQQINSSEYFILSNLNSEKEITRVFEDGEAHLVLLFSPSKSMLGFDVQLISDATEPNQAVSASYYILEMIRSVDEKTEVMQRALGGLGSEPLRIESETKMLYNPQIKSSYNFVPGIMGMILMLICAMMTSVAIVREKETGTMEQILVSPVNPLSIIISKLVPYFVLSVINVITIMMVSVLVMGLPMPSNPLWLALLSLIFIIVCLSLGVLVSSLSSTQVAAILISGMGFLMPTMILSGMVFPIASMPEFLQWFSAIIPARWFIAGARKLMIQDVSGFYVWKEFAVLGFMAVVILFVSLKKFKVRL
ncbi:MAG: ABC transporter permease [Bacteroidales bacterium]|jgi:ABC-2 type transport system permease protein|nr:ABC transporter permease [Bacteroidales bacterium]